MENNHPFALITGASSGIGLQYARVIAERGYNLLVVSNEDCISERAQELEQTYGVRAIGLVMDLGREVAAQELHTYCCEQGLDIEVLINNAGVYHDRDFLNDSEAFNHLILNLHMMTPAMLCYHFGQDMVERGKGYILNMCSITSRIAVQRLSTYGGTKAFLSAFTRSLHIELHNRGVVVTDVSPGAVNTGLYSIASGATKVGLALGYIVSPEYLARRAVKAMFRGRAKVTIPAVWNHILLFLIALIPTCALRLVRKLGIF